MTHRETIFSFDVESIGLFGEAFAVAGGVYSPVGPVSEFCFSCDPALCRGTDVDREWVAKNVPPEGAQPIPITHATPRDMREAFWQEWSKARAKKLPVLAHCLWPVEARFLDACVADAPDARRWQSPYPFHELATFLFSKGKDPVNGLPREPEDKKEHDPRDDARRCARQFFHLLED